MVKNSCMFLINFLLHMTFFRPHSFRSVRWQVKNRVEQRLRSQGNANPQLQVGHWSIDTSCVPVSYPATPHGDADLMCHFPFDHPCHESSRKRFWPRSLRCHALSCLTSRCLADTAHFQVLKCEVNIQKHSAKVYIVVSKCKSIYSS